MRRSAASQPAVLQQELDEPLETLLESVVIAASNAPRRKEIAASLRDALGSVSTEPVWVELRTLLDTVIEAAGAGALLTTRVVRMQTNEPVYAYVDYAHLSLALLHVLENAVTAANQMPLGEVWITIHSGFGGGAYIEIADNGPGMDRDTLRQAFSPFFSTREANGMGLPIARAMLEACGGNIELQSEPFAGTVAMVQLPAHDLTSVE